MLSKKVLKSPEIQYEKDLTACLMIALASFKGTIAFHGFGIFKDIGTADRFSGAELVALKIQERRTLPLRDVILVDKDDTLVTDKHPALPIDLTDINWHLVENLRKKSQEVICILISNQPGVAKGYFTQGDVIKQIEQIRELVATKNFYIDSYEFCPHHPDSGFDGEISELKVRCYCRKPLPGLVVRLFNTCEFRPDKVVMYGDSFRDKQLADILGIQFEWSYKGSQTKRFANTLLESLRLRKILREKLT